MAVLGGIWFSKDKQSVRVFAGSQALANICLWSALVLLAASQAPAAQCVLIHHLPLFPPGMCEVPEASCLCSYPSTALWVCSHFPCSMRAPSASSPAGLTQLPRSPRLQLMFKGQRIPNAPSLSSFLN